MQKNRTDADKAREIHRDADGQFAPTQADGKNNGIADAKPRVINKSEDATVHNRPPQKGSAGRS